MNLARRSVLKHPSGIEIKTPLLIPSFSSKGFIFPPKQATEKDGYIFFQSKIKLTEKSNPTSGKISEVAKLIKNVSETLTDTMLVSAYDMFHKHIPIPYENTTPEIIFLDSGGYEIGDTFDYSEIIRSAVNPNEWNYEMHKEILKAWPDYVPAVFVSFDLKGKPIAEQIEASLNVLSKFKNKQLCTILIKPISDEVTFEKTYAGICENISKLKHFDIIGVAEKELGNSISMVMQNISKIRLALDEAKINAPLHIFGSLDPLTSWLYYISGAELFDGLTWLRYVYSNGRSFYYREHGIIFREFDKKEDEIKVEVLENNLHYLKNLQLEMSEYAIDGDFAKISFNGDLVKEWHKKVFEKEI
ncbi:MAG: hypothetical protein WC476_04165 [Phycisphaerae bacterium]|jgi:hypothetical protein